MEFPVGGVALCLHLNVTGTFQTFDIVDDVLGFYCRHLFRLSHGDQDAQRFFIRIPLRFRYRLRNIARQEELRALPGEEMALAAPGHVQELPGIARQLPNVFVEDQGNPQAAGFVLLQLALKVRVAVLKLVPNLGLGGKEQTVQVQAQNPKILALEIRLVVGRPMSEPVNRVVGQVVNDNLMFYRFPCDAGVGEIVTLFERELACIHHHSFLTKERQEGLHVKDRKRFPAASVEFADDGSFRRLQPA